ncbi:hypothetical protein KPRYC492_14165 [Klebsiella pneumoniae RYC492]|nr:hypothetical protein KPRYC492_14165 [Klebsiella pneumoniae RYC492]
MFEAVMKRLGLADSEFAQRLQQIEIERRQLEIEMATANDKLQDESIAHAIWVSRYSTGVANRMIKVLNDSDAELTARLLVAIDTLDAESFTVGPATSKLIVWRAYPIRCGRVFSWAIRMSRSQKRFVDMLTAATRMVRCR